MTESSGGATAPAATGLVHACAGAGRWFPADAEQLGRLVDGYLSGIPSTLSRPPIALIVPHAGYPFSGLAAGKAYATLKGRTYRRVILFGVSHQMPLRGASVLKVDAYDTPLGRIPVDLEAVDALLKCPVVKEVAAAHQTEHSVENQLPFLQRVLKDFRMAEMLVGEMTPDERAALANAVRPLVDNGTLVVVSSDFTHFGPNYGYVPFRERIPESLMARNETAVQKILRVDLPGWDQYLDQTKDTICGRAGIGLLLKVLEPWADVRAARLAYDTSATVTGDYTNVVVYAAVAFWREGEGLTAAEQATLLRLARDTVTQFLTTGQAPAVDPAKYDLTAALKAPGAAFVTLKNAGQLRGCIGTFVARAALWEMVREMALAALRDPRFVSRPVTAAEMRQIDIEISALSPLEKIKDPLKDIELGRHGIYIKGARASGCFLPQVATETGWSKEEFLSHCAADKAGLSPDAWKDPQTEVYRFTARVFGEREAAGKKE
jgi:hypothetical protein